MGQGQESHTVISGREPGGEGSKAGKRRSAAVSDSHRGREFISRDTFSLPSSIILATLAFMENTQRGTSAKNARTKISDLNRRHLRAQFPIAKGATPGHDQHTQRLAVFGGERLNEVGQRSAEPVLFCCQTESGQRQILLFELARYQVCL